MTFDLIGASLQTSTAFRELSPVWRDSSIMRGCGARGVDANS